jgi:hypothetical protein
MINILYIKLIKTKNYNLSLTKGRERYELKKVMTSFL